MLTSPRLNVRLAGTADLEAVIGVLTDAAGVTISKGVTDRWPTRFSTEPLRRCIETGTLYVAESLNAVVATFILQWEDKLWWGEQPPVAGYVHRLAVARHVRGQGCGGLLLDWARHRVQESGRSLLRLDCTAHNPGLRRYYGGLGFRWVRDATVVIKAGMTATDSLYESVC